MTISAAAVIGARRIRLARTVPRARRITLDAACLVFIALTVAESAKHFHVRMPPIMAILPKSARKQRFHTQWLSRCYKINPYT
ncbi:MAG: hypothetical protein U1A24_21160 [Cypionkella sp.]|uniref:hypothetical protein n=1 Tax=Cypionkella sp. TaxID=2811411 RepID=UPI002AB8431B|nr:hypothetical protein [Cypionkella sp.]MDZ4313064.1 hypothetical protein [Cypionkella sp.]